MKILGISSFYHDSAVALTIDGKIVSAVQEERFTRIKHDANFPINSLKFCLNNSNLKIDEIDYIVFYEKPFLKFERIIESTLSFAPYSYEFFRTSVPHWVKKKLFQKTEIVNHLKKLGALPNIKNKILFSQHHLSHAASAFFPSPFKEAAILTLDGVGEWATTTIGIGYNNTMKLVNEICFPHSLGLLYSAFTYFLGFKVNSGEYKVMGLAPYGSPIYVNKILDNIIDVKTDGSFRLNMEYFNYCTGLKMTSNKFSELFNIPVRTPESEIVKKHMDIASSIQYVIESVILKIASYISVSTGKKNLCLAGGVALNCVANAKILKSGLFDNIWIQPASGDAGGAIGAALVAYHMHQKKCRNVITSEDKMSGSYLGPSYTKQEIIKKLEDSDAVFSIIEKKEDLIRLTANLLAQGNIIGWFQGRAEFGPRALGNRSILADPRPVDMQKKLNLRIKYRESFRPFAPAVLKEFYQEWFDLKQASPYMLFIADILKHNKNLNNLTDVEGFNKLKYIESEVPAVTHVDYTARIQTVDKKYNELFYNLILEFKNITDCPMLVNTSFNIRGEPIVNSPEDAFNCFINTEMDYLIVGNCFLEKNKQKSKQISCSTYINNYELD
jgi:carbamoyltransferase